MLAHDPFGTLQSLYQSYGPIAALVQDEPPIVVALGPEATRQLLATPNLSHPLCFLLARMSGNMNSSEHPGMLPLHPRSRELMHANTVTLTQQMTQRWSVGRELDATYTMTSLLFRVACLSLFGPLPVGMIDELEQSWRRWTHACSPAALQVVPHPLFRMSARRLQHLSIRLAGDMRRVIAATRTRLDVPDASPERLIRWDEHSDVDEQALIAQMMLLFVVAHAGGAALAWTLFLLSQHPPILADLHKKLWTASRGNAPTLEELDGLALLNDVVNESLRLLPPVSLGYCTTTSSIELGGYTLGPGTTIMYSPFVTHRTPGLYLWPNAFRPERWRVIAPDLHQFLPFGAHEDVVAYAPLAYLMVRLVLSMVVQHAFLGLAPGARIDLQMRMSLESRAGLPMVIAPVDRLVTRRLPEGSIRAAVRV
jgi:cytochrome P450